MTLKLSYVAFILTFLRSTNFSESSCFPCDNPRAAYETCGRDKEDIKIVDFSGLCAKNCHRPAESCSHQIGRNGSECQFVASYGTEGCSRDVAGRWPILQCDGPSGKCECPPTTSGYLPLEDLVVITAYPFECCVKAKNQYRTTPDILITNNGWQELSIVSAWNHQGGVWTQWWCGQFRLTRAAVGTRLQYDCPTHKGVNEGTATSLQICTRDQTVRYLFNMPYLSNISKANRSVLSWEPVIAVYMHRSDMLVYSVQRSPPSLNISEYDVQLVHCEMPECSRYHTIEGTERRVRERPSASEYDPEVFKLTFDRPEEAGNISLLVKPLNGRPTLSAVLHHPGKNTLQMVLFVSIVVFFLLVIIAGFVCFKLYYKPSAPAELEVLVLYNRNPRLARRLARQLETHCMIKTKLDEVDIPRANTGMDPAKWLTTELQRCQAVLLLVFPESTAPSIYSHLYDSALRHLQGGAGKKRIVIGYADNKSSVVLPRLPAVRCWRLPAQLGTMIRALRGAAYFGKGCVDAHELARRLTTSEGGRALAAMLARPTEMPPPEVAPLPTEDGTRQPPPALPPPMLSKTPVLGDEHEVAPHVASTDIILDPLFSNGNGQPPAADDSDSDTDIVWS